MTNFRTRWAYLRFPKSDDGNVQIPLVIMESCVGHGEGSKLLTETQGIIMESLIAAEQGAAIINNIHDLREFIDWDNVTSLAIDEELVQDELLIPIEVLKENLDNLQTRGYVIFKEAFFNKNCC